MSLIKTSEEIEKLKTGGQILARILSVAAKLVKPGISTYFLEEVVREEIRKAGVEAAFRGYGGGRGRKPYPAALCTSVNDEVVHCVPNRKRVLKEGDIIGLDLGIKYEDLFTDAATTVSVGKISRAATRLINTTREALVAGIKQIKAGNYIGDISAAIEAVGRREQLSVIRDLVGHGVGHAVHEEPSVPNTGKPGTLEQLKVGMVLAIEPMFTLGDYKINFLDDGWSVVTTDGSLAAHFEHTVAVRENGSIVLTK
ncbi:MAG: type I methionyl aminopeptidase [Candidatus Doudnabacteria bacterium]|nr:type I methionyl aminopeptidase [Candidatus Doudnabacteria bacterium]